MRPERVQPVSLADAAAALPKGSPDITAAPGTGAGAWAVEVTGVSINSGQVLPGDLYLALPGARHHGAGFAADAAAAGYQDLGFSDVRNCRDFLYNLKDFNVAVVRCKARVIIYNLRLCTFHAGNLLHNARSYGCHLRTVVRAGNRSDGVSAECRTGHKQLLVLLFLSWNRSEWEVTDFKAGAVCRKSGLDTGTGARAKVTANRSRTYQHDFRLVFIDD